MAKAIQKSWNITPADSEIINAKNWKKIGKKGRAIGRQHLLIVHKENPTLKKGPILDVQNLIPGTEYCETRRIKEVKKHTKSVETTLAETISEHLSKEVLTKVGTQFKAQINIQATLSSELQTKISNTLIQTIETSIKNVESFSIEYEKEETKSIKFILSHKKEPQKEIQLTTHLLLREHIWEVYLIQSDYFHLILKKYPIVNWFDSRETISQYNITSKKPLFKLIFYVPENKISYTENNYKPEVFREKEIIVKPFKAKCPGYKQPVYKSLESLAKIAFPITDVEKDEAEIMQVRYSHSSNNNNRKSSSVGSSSSRSGSSLSRRRSISKYKSSKKIPRKRFTKANNAKTTKKTVSKKSVKKAARKSARKF